MRTAVQARRAVLAALCALGLTGCGESLSNTETSQLLPKQTGDGASLSPSKKPVTTAAAGATSMPSAPSAGISTATAKSSSSTKSTADSFIAVTTPGNTAYKIGPEDVLDISVFKVPELSKTAQVADSGTINLPLVGEIDAAGKTARDLEVELTKKLGAKYLNSPQVTVFVKEYNSQRVTVEGAVKKPGVYPIRGKTSLLQTVANAGGLEELADQTSVIVMRQAEGKRYAARFDMDAIRKGSADDPALQQGDVVIVNTSDAKQALQTFLKIIPVANVFALL